MLNARLSLSSVFDELQRYRKLLMEEIRQYLIDETSVSCPVPYCTGIKTIDASGNMSYGSAGNIYLMQPSTMDDLPVESLLAILSHLRKGEKPPLKKYRGLLTTLDCVPSFSAPFEVEAISAAHADCLAVELEFEDLEWTSDIGWKEKWENIYSSEVVPAAGTECTG